MNGDGSGRTVLTRDGQRNRGPVVTPDERYIVYLAGAVRRFFAVDNRGADRWRRPRRHLRPGSACVSRKSRRERLADGFSKSLIGEPVSLLHASLAEGRMEARAKLFGHPIHQMLIVFPLGLLATALVFDLIALVLNRHQGLFSASHYMTAAGVVGGLLAAVFGLIDFLKIPSGTRAKRVGRLHGGGNVVVVALFAASWWVRCETPTDPPTLAIVLAAAGAGLAAITGWLGGELVDRLGVGVDDGAHLDAPSSLSGQPAGPPR